MNIWSIAERLSMTLKLSTGFSVLNYQFTFASLPIRARVAPREGYSPKTRSTSISFLRGKSCETPA